MTPYLDKAMARIPSLADAGVRTFFCGPESFTADVVRGQNDGTEYATYTFHSSSKRRSSTLALRVFELHLHWQGSVNQGALIGLCDKNSSQAIETVGPIAALTLVKPLPITSLMGP